MGLVAGATDIPALKAVRTAAPNIWILCPGVGAQGGDAQVMMTMIMMTMMLMMMTMIVIMMTMMMMLMMLMMTMIIMLIFIIMIMAFKCNDNDISN